MSDETNAITVATWNLWWRFGEWRERRQAILSVLHDLQPDLLCLQEVWSEGEIELSAVIADDLGYEQVLAISPRSDRWQARVGDAGVGFGNAILSRWPIEASKTIPLPAGDAPDEGRLALVCQIATPYGGLPLINTHLNSGWAQSSIRAAQLQCIGEAISELDRREFPPVLCGDFNAGDDFDEIRSLSGKSDPLVPGLRLNDVWWATHPGDTGYTWDRDNPLVTPVERLSARLDYVFVGMPDQSLRGLPLDARRFGTSPVDGCWASDHYGVLAELNATNFGAPKP